MSECSHNCSTCSSNCGERTAESLRFPANKDSDIRRVIAVVSGKGGVGKSFVTSYLATTMNRRGYSTAILDADITGPSIPQAFGLHEEITGSELGMNPAETMLGTKVMSVNMLLEDEESPVLWRGPVIGGVVKQFWQDVFWNQVDYMFVDMPPGTGDVPLTVFQSLPLDGIIIVTSPQELVSMIVAKAVNMAKTMNIPILGLVENYSYVECPDCGKHINVFGNSHVFETAEKFGIPVLAQLPMNPAIAEHVDAGAIEALQGDWLDEAAKIIEKNLPAIYNA